MTITNKRKHRYKKTSKYDSIVERMIRYEYDFNQKSLELQFKLIQEKLEKYDNISKEEEAS